MSRTRDRDGRGKCTGWHLSLDSGGINGIDKVTTKVTYSLYNCSCYKKSSNDAYSNEIKIRKPSKSIEFFLPYYTISSSSFLFDFGPTYKERFLKSKKPAYVQMNNSDPTVSDTLC